MSSLMKKITTRATVNIVPRDALSMSRTRVATFKRATIPPQLALTSNLKREAQRTARRYAEALFPHSTLIRTQKV